MTEIVLIVSGLIGQIITAAINLSASFRYTLWAMGETALGAGCLAVGVTTAGRLVSVVCFAPAAYYAVMAVKHRRKLTSPAATPIRATGRQHRRRALTRRLTPAGPDADSSGGRRHQARPRHQPHRRKGAA